MKSKLWLSVAAALVILAAMEAGCGNKSTSETVPDAAPGSSVGTKLVTMTDPNLNMRAYSLSIPANWNFQGMVIQGTPCSVGAFPVFRATSPDGLTGIKFLPRLDWAWSDGRNYQPPANSACMPYKQPIPAADFLKYMLGVLNVNYLRDEPTPQLADIRKNAEARSTPQFTSTVDMAAARVTYNINKIPIDEVLSVLVNCSSYEVIMLGRQHTCSANVTRSWAPQGKYSEATFKPISKSFVIDQEWNAKWNAVMAQRIRDMAQQGGQMVRAFGQQFQQQREAQHTQWMAAQDMRQRQHEEFMATMQRGTDMSMQRTAASANARQHSANDWCDYALDLQRRRDPNTGEITRDSNAYSYTWVNESGQRFQTDDINANPNGNGTGNWTIQENVR